MVLFASLASINGIIHINSRHFFSVLSNFNDPTIKIQECQLKCQSPHNNAIYDANVLDHALSLKHPLPCPRP